MSALTWIKIGTYLEWTQYEAETDIGTYIMFANYHEGACEVVFLALKIGSVTEYVCGLFDIDKAKDKAEFHYKAHKGGHDAIR